MAPGSQGSAQKDPKSIDGELLAMETSRKFMKVQSVIDAIYPNLSFFFFHESFGRICAENLGSI